MRATLAIPTTPTPTPFSTRERRTLCALVARIAPPVPGPPPEESATRLLLFFSAQSRLTRWGVRLLLWAVEYVAILGTGHRFSRLPPFKQDAYLRRWEKSRLYGRRFALVMMKGMVFLTFFHDRRAQRAFHYDPTTPGAEAQP